MHRTSQHPGQQPVEERYETDHAGRRVEGQSGAQHRVKDVTEEEDQAERDRAYEEKMEDEYAKREGGA